MAIGSSAKVELDDFNVIPAGPDAPGKMPLARRSGGDDFPRSVAEAVLQLVMETDVESLIGPGCYERSGEPATYRNGCRDCSRETGLGSLHFRVPNCGRGRIFRRFSSRGGRRGRRWWRCLNTWWAASQPGGSTT